MQISWSTKSAALAATGMQPSTAAACQQKILSCACLVLCSPCSAQILEKVHAREEGLHHFPCSCKTLQMNLRSVLSSCSSVLTHSAAAVCDIHAAVLAAVSNGCLSPAGIALPACSVAARWCRSRGVAAVSEPHAWNKGSSTAIASVLRLIAHHARPVLHLGDVYLVQRDA